MPSGLMRKLNAMRAEPTRAQNPPVRALVERAASFPADDRLFSLSPAALRRMGYAGRGFDISRALFIDTETTGLSGGAGTVAFLVGIGFVRGGYFTVEQYLMPDYAGEAALLSRLAEKFPDFDTAVHFNGKTFDMPLLRSRFVLHRMENLWKEMDQLDLLIPARRLWKLRLGSCRLSSLEEKALGIPRDGDIPGSEIPGRYFEAVKTGSLAGLEDVIAHNRQDIVTLSALLCALAERYERPEDARETADLLSLGKTFEAQGELRQARRLYHMAAAPRPAHTVRDLAGERYAGEAGYRLYRVYRRAGNYADAEMALKSMLRRGQMGQIPKLELCKLYEHRLKRYSEALEIARELLAACPPSERDGLEKREARILRKMQKSGGGPHVVFHQIQGPQGVSGAHSGQPADRKGRD